MDITNATIASTAEILSTPRFVANGGNGWTHNPAEDNTFYCLAFNYQGVIASYARFNFTISGFNPYVAPVESPTILPTSPWMKTALPPPVVTIQSTAGILADFYTDYNRRNWVAWSRIGEVTFTIDKSDDAGWQPMPWQGWVYQLKMLGNNTIAYGQNGITVLVPNEMSMFKHVPPTFGKTPLHTNGLLGKTCLCGDDKDHYFIDAIGQLCHLDAKGVTVLGYSEFLYPMKFMGTPIVMFYEYQKKWVYICNGQTGFIFTAGGLGGGPWNLTGLQYLGLTPLYVSNGPLLFDNPWFCSEFFDLGSRDIKNLYQVYICTSTQMALQGMVEYRSNTTQPYSQSTWNSFDNQGRAFFNVAGVEFRVHVQAEGATPLTVDDFKVYMRLMDRTLKQIQFPKGGV